MIKIPYIKNPQRSANVRITFAHYTAGKAYPI